MPLPTQPRRSNGLEEIAMLKALQPSMAEPMQIFRILAQIQQDEQQNAMRQQLLPAQQADLEAQAAYHQAGTRHLDAQTQAAGEFSGLQQIYQRGLQAKNSTGNSNTSEADIARVEAVFGKEAAERLRAEGHTTTSPSPPSGMMQKGIDVGNFLTDVITRPYVEMGKAAIGRPDNAITELLNFLLKNANPTQPPASLMPLGY